MQVSYQNENSSYVLTPEFENEKKRLQYYQPSSKEFKVVPANATGYRLLEILDKDLHGQIGIQDPQLRVKYNPDLLPDGFRLFEHQIPVFENFVTYNQHAGFLEMGLGKTAVSIATMITLLRAGIEDKFMVVCPKRVIPTWKRELDKFAKGILHPIVVAEGIPNAGRGQMINLAWAMPGVVVITNYETFQLGKETVEFLFEHGPVWGAVFLDESVKIRYTDTQIYRGLMKIQHKFKRRYVLSGLPAPQSPADYVGQLSFLHPVYMGYRSREPFEKDYGKKDYWGRNEGWKDLPWIHGRVHDVATVLKKSDSNVKLPEKIYKPMYVPMTKEQSQHYHELATFFITWVKGLDGSRLALESPNVLSKIVRLTQLTGGWLGGLKDPTFEVMPWHEQEDIPTLPPQPLNDGNPKLELLAELLEEVEKPFVVVSRFLHEVEAIKKLMITNGLRADSVTGGLSIKRQEEMERQFREGDLDVIILQSESGKYGLNLQNAHTLIYYSNSYNYDSRGQSEDRVHRIGQKNTVTIVDILCEGTIDEEVLNALNGKKELSELLLKNPERVLPNEYLAYSVKEEW